MAYSNTGLRQIAQGIGGGPAMWIYSSADAHTDVDASGASHSSNCSIGLAFSEGNEPTTPALHWARTRSGLEIINKGAPTTGTLSRPCITFGIAIVCSLALNLIDVIVNVNYQLHSISQEKL